MTPIEMHHAITRQLASDLREILADQSKRDWLTLERGTINNIAEALTLADRKITSLENIARATAGALREILALEPMCRFDVGHVLSVLDAVEETLR